MFNKGNMVNSFAVKYCNSPHSYTAFRQSPFLPPSPQERKLLAFSGFVFVTKKKPAKPAPGTGCILFTGEASQLPQGGKRGGDLHV
jgi:hypothetical protein